MNDAGPGGPHPHIIAHGAGFADVVLINEEALRYANGLMASNAILKDRLVMDQWWDANIQENRVLVRWGEAVQFGGVEHLPDGGVVVTYPDGRITF